MRRTRYHYVTCQLIIREDLVGGRCFGPAVLDRKLSLHNVKKISKTSVDDTRSPVPSVWNDEGDPAPSAASGDVGFGSSCVIWELQKLNKGLQDLRQDVANLESKVDTLSGSLNDKFQGELLTAQNENYVLKDEKRILAASHFRSEQNIRKWMTIEQDLKKQQEDLVKQLGGEIEKRKETEKRLEDILKKFQEEQVKRVDIEKRLEDLMRKLEGQANLHE